MVEDLSQERKLSPEEEIHELEQKLREKKQELTEAGKEMPHEREVFYDVLKEHIETVRTATEITHPTLSSTAATAATPSLIHNDASDVAKKNDVDKAIQTALSQGIPAAVRQVRNSPYLLDELHDHLDDDYYEKLVASRKVTQL